MGSCVITPAGVKQIRSLFFFVRATLSKLGYDGPQSEDIYHTVGLSINKFQRDFGIPEAPCNRETIKMLLMQLLLKGGDPVNTLASCGVDIQIESAPDQKFGPIDMRNLDDIAKRFVTGISRAVADVETELLSVAKSGSEGLEPVNRSSQMLSSRLGGVKRYAAELCSETKTALNRAVEAEKGIENLQHINNDIEKAMQDRLNAQNGSANWMIISFFILVFLFIWQHIKRGRKINLP